MSVRERTWKTPTGETKSAWEVDYRDAGGIRRRKLFDRKKDADNFRAQAHVEVRNGTHTADSASVTVAVAAQQWLDNNGGEAPWERATHVAYSQHVNLHIVPLIGAVKLSQLTVPALAAFERNLRAKGCSPVMIKKARTSLGSILALAQDSGLVAQNVVRARGRVRSSKRTEGGKLKVGIDIPSPAEIKALVPHLQGRLRALFLTAIFTGLRWSELRGLRWANVDLGAGELHVTERIDRFGAVGPTKSAAGERTVPLGPFIVNTLKAHKLATGGQGLVFVNSKAQVEQRTTTINALQAAQVAAGIVDGEGKAKYTGLHALRHFYASWCINPVAAGGLGLDIKTVQARMGHATIGITADTYSHLFPRADDGAELAAGELALVG